ncbi:hypothetical protein L3K78_13395 [Oscillospiraceae bacterium SCCA1]|nr:hypothetical protein [Oscillospiraceae bacterium SCCA1]
MQAGLLVEFAKREAGELLGAHLGFAAVGNAVAAVEGAAGEEKKAYKLPKILSKRCAKGSSDGAAEGDAGEAVGSEREARDAVEGEGLSVLLVNLGQIEQGNLS